MSQLVRITRHPNHSSEFLLESKILLPKNREDVFPFFADAFQLETITPPWLHFQVLTKSPIPMQSGQKIDYKLRLHGLPIRWQSEICEWEPPFRFIDRQLKGPYIKWHHEHTFEEHPQGTLVNDRVEYAVPGGWLVNRFFVQGDLAKIFQYRHQKLAEIFAAEG